ncbi:MAG: hypothetical protein LBC27_01855 [Spirochaetaceae bacterium]|nr:hypothetical protein [Spirochaetaceae bacterium]
MLKKQGYHYGREAEKHEMKMSRYRRFLEKQNSREILEKSAFLPSGLKSPDGLRKIKTSYAVLTK